MRRPCLGPSPGIRCPYNAITPDSRCRPCRQAMDRRRGTRQQRGYDANHDRARAALSMTLPAWCAYGCGTWLTSQSRWVAAHAQDGQPDYGWVLSCPSCNERAKVRTA